MTYKEAREIMLENACADSFGGSDAFPSRNFIWNMAINAIERQIPEEPKTKGHTKTSTGLRERLHCPNCNRRLKNDRHMRFCPRCGQAIDWSGRE